MSDKSSSSVVDGSSSLVRFKCPRVRGGGRLSILAFACNVELVFRRRGLRELLCDRVPRTVCRARQVPSTPCGVVGVIGGEDSCGMLSWLYAAKRWRRGRGPLLRADGSSIVNPSSTTSEAEQWSCSVWPRGAPADAPNGGAACAGISYMWEQLQLRQATGAVKRVRRSRWEAQEADRRSKYGTTEVAGIRNRQGKVVRQATRACWVRFVGSKVYAVSGSRGWLGMVE